MALRFVDSFDHYDTDHIYKKYNFFHDLTSSPRIESTFGRFGTGAFVQNDFLDERAAGITLDNQATWIIGFALRVEEGDVGGNSRLLVGLHDRFNINVAFDTMQVGLFVTPRYQLQVRSGNSHTSPFDDVELGTSTKIFRQSTYEYIEFKATINSAGSFEVRVNGETWLSGTGDTNISANNFANVITIGQHKPTGGVNEDFSYDDLYICDGSGADHNDFLGDVRIERLLPTVSIQSDWSLFDVGSSATMNFEVVDEGAVPDNDNTFVAGSAVGQRDLYEIENPSTQAGTIIGVQTHIYARKTGAGSRTLRTVLVAAGTHQGTEFYFDGEYYYLREIFPINPLTVVRWTIDEINALQVGMDIES